MKIDYDAITTKAHKRQAALRKCANNIAYAVDTIKVAEQLRMHLMALNTGWDELDDEGRAMLPKDVRRTLDRMGAYLSDLNDLIGEPKDAPVDNACPLEGLHALKAANES